MSVWEGENFHESGSGESAVPAGARPIRSHSHDSARESTNFADPLSVNAFAANTLSGKLPAGQRMLIIAVAAVFLWSALFAALRAAA